MANPTVVVSQGIEHFRYMTRLRYSTVGGAVAETVTIGDITLSPEDYIRVILDPNVNSTPVKIIEIKASRSQTNGTISIGSADGTTNIPVGLSLEILIIRKQAYDGVGVSAHAGRGNPADSLFGHQDTTDTVTNNFNSTPSKTVNVSALITSDSVIWIDQKTVCANAPSGFVEKLSTRVSGTSFSIVKANTGETPASVVVTLDYIVFNL